MAGARDVDGVVELANDLRAIILRLARHLRSQAHVSGLTGGQVAILVAIEFNPGITSQELAEREGLSGPGVSGHLARLEGMGLIQRERTPGQLGVGLFLTVSGTALVGMIREQRTSWLTERLEGLAPSDRDAIRASLPILDQVSLGDR